MIKQPDAPLIPAISAIMDRIAHGMELEKCRKCGCMQSALEGAEPAFNAAEEPAVRGLTPSIQGYKAMMEPIAYDCLGCKTCWGAEATIFIAERFEESLETCSGGTCTPLEAERTWPPYPGDYVVGNPAGTMAVCTLSNYDLAASVIAQKESSIAIAGRCDTENIGIEKIVLNLLAKPSIRWLILCGNEAPGHRAGDALLHLKEDGVDANMRIMKAASWRPVLKNLSMLNVARFREQVEVVNLVGTTQTDTIRAIASECAMRPVKPLSSATCCSPQLVAERIKAVPPKRLELDPAGFFVILLKREAGVIVCEHYENDGSLTHTVEDKNAALIASTVVERGLITRLDHAAYLGRELTKAETAIRTGSEYVQDAALGALKTESCSDSSCSCH